MGLSSLLAESIGKDADRYSFFLLLLFSSVMGFSHLHGLGAVHDGITHGITASHHGITFLRTLHIYD